MLHKKILEYFFVCYTKKYSSIFVSTLVYPFLLKKSSKVSEKIQKTLNFLQFFSLFLCLHCKISAVFYSPCTIIYKVHQII